MSVTIEQLKDLGIEVGDKVRLTRTTVHEGTVKKGYLTGAAIVVPDNPAAVGHDVRGDDKIELIKAAQPEPIYGEFYRPISGPFSAHTYKYAGDGVFLAYVDGHGRDLTRLNVHRGGKELGRLKRVKLQVVDA